MAPFIDHSEYEPTSSINCECGWEGLPTHCFSTLHAAYLDIECPHCKEVALVVDTLGTECGTFVPNRPKKIWQLPRIAAAFSF